MDGLYWTFVSISVPFHPVFSPPVARARTLGGDVLDGSVSNILLGLGALVGVFRLLYSLTIISERFGTHLLMGMAVLPSAAAMVLLVAFWLFVGFATALAPTFTPAAAGADRLYQGWWHTFGGSIAGLCLMLFGKLDFDEMYYSAFPAGSVAIFTAFVLALIFLAASAVVGAASAGYAKRYDEAHARWAWLRMANVMRAETGSLAARSSTASGGRSRTVPLGYSQCDVVRPEAYCRALPLPTEPPGGSDGGKGGRRRKRLARGSVQMCSTTRMESFFGKPTQQLQVRTWCLVMLQDTSRAAGKDASAAPDAGGHGGSGGSGSAEAAAGGCRGSTTSPPRGCRPLLLPANQSGRLALHPARRRPRRRRWLR